MSKTVGVIFGGRSGEHEVSLMSAQSVLEALGQAGYETVEIGIDLDGHWYSGPNARQAFESGSLQELDRVALLAEPGANSLFRWGLGTALETLAELDVVFPVLHGPFGEDGTLQGLLELADVPYVGAGVLASSVAMDKGLFKELMQSHGLPVLPFAVIQGRLIREDPQAAVVQAESVGSYPLFAKPANLGSSVGVTKCRSHGDMVEGLLEAAQYDRRVIVEQGIEAREIEISILGNEKAQASIAGEVVPSREFYSYEAKYLDDASELHIPAPIDDELMAEVKRIALDAYHAIDGAGMARVDFLLELDTDRLYLNEINTIPGFTRISMYPKLWAASGIEYPELCDRLVELALARQEQKDGLVRQLGGRS